MARVIKEEEYAVRRNDILDVAQRLVYTKGYDQTSIQDILQEAGISKGAFYHYFDSKGALLEALIERMQDVAEQFLSPVLQDPDLPALEKLQRYFSTIGSWKTANKTYVMALLHIWYADSNAIVRQKMVTSMVRRFSPHLTCIIRQGMHEGRLHPAFPDQAGEVALSLLQGMGDTLAGLLLTNRPPPQQQALQQVDDTVAAYTDALERVLGASSGSIQLMDMATLKQWFV